MNILLIILAAWLAPAIIGYILVSASSKKWHITEHDLVLLMPLVNLIVLGLILMLTTESFLFKLFRNE